LHTRKESHLQNSQALPTQEKVTNNKNEGREEKGNQGALAENCCMKGVVETKKLVAQLFCQPH
jgi:hypothetical protein